MSHLKDFSLDASRDRKNGKTKMITMAEITPLKFGRVKGTEIIRAIECKVSITYDDGQITHHHVPTLREGINGAYKVAQQKIYQNMKERGVA